MKTPALSLLLVQLLVSYAAVPPLLSAQSTPFKDEVDALVRGLRVTTRPDGSYADGTVATVARVLSAMGNCHRFYGVHDGPIVQPQLNFMFKHRTGIGAFDERSGKGDPAVTRAVIEALATMGPMHYDQELIECRAYLRDKKAEGPGPLAQLTATLRKQMQGEETKKTLDETTKQLAGAARRGLLTKPDGTPDLEASVQALQHLVAMQVLAREGQGQSEGQNPSQNPAQNQNQNPSQNPKDPAKPQDPNAYTGLFKSAQSPESRPQAPAFRPSAQKAIDFLMKGQKDGKFLIGPPGREVADLGITSMGIAALQTKPKEQRSEAEQAAIEKGLAWIAEAQTESGSIGKDNVNYVTCAGMYALARAGAQYKAQLEKAKNFILGLQNVEGRGYAKSDRDFGSIGYGADERGDLSNLQFAIEALRVAGVAEQDEALQKAIVFLERTQNLKSVNDFRGKVRDVDESGEWLSVASGDDGGSAYYPGNSPMGYIDLPDGTKVPRSYGSMTYCLLKAYTLCGVSATDPRVRAAVGWIEKNWTLAENPGADVKRLGDKGKFQGLYYYYMVMAQALDLAKVDKIGQVDWRAELRKHLEGLQRPDGTWVNEKNGRWWENVPTLCTVYALLALEKCR